MEHVGSHKPICIHLWIWVKSFQKLNRIIRFKTTSFQADTPLYGQSDKWSIALKYTKS